jgi:hypothetical protein
LKPKRRISEYSEEPAAKRHGVFSWISVHSYLILRNFIPSIVQSVDFDLHAHDQHCPSGWTVFSCQFNFQQPGG